MVNRIKNIFVFLAFFVVAIFRLLINSFFALKKIKDALSDGAFVLIPFYQSLIILIVTLLYTLPIAQVLSSFIEGHGDTMFAILLTFAIIGTILFINALLELLFRLFARKHTFKSYFSKQKQAHNYIMSIISLFAIYATIDTTHADEINIMLLTFGILIFICIVITDLYDSLFLSQNVVKKIYINLIIRYCNNKYK